MARLPAFAVLDATPHPCPYLPGREATLPLRLPLGPLSPEGFDALLARGERRAGPLVYRTRCEACSACEPLRVPVRRFVPSRSQARVLRRNADLVVEVGPAVADEERVALYNRHKEGRDLDAGEGPLDVEAFHRHYVVSCARTVEVRYLAAGRLVGLSILDLGRRSASSVYHCFEPDEGRRSLGVFSACHEIALAREWGLEWYYLGLWVSDCRRLAYKASYLPHQRLRDGRWRDFEPGG